jgi:hypothetical protein
MRRTPRKAALTRPALDFGIEEQNRPGYDSLASLGSFHGWCTRNDVVHLKRFNLSFIFHVRSSGNDEGRTCYE